MNIKFSYLYDKLLNEHNDCIDNAILIEVLNVNLESLSASFIEYDTNCGIFKLPKKGKYLMLIFLKQKENYICSNDLFTTLRRWTEDKEKYYRESIGTTFDIIIEKYVL